jgi:branched-chain amino acid transport system ATP-binding protein
MEKTSCLAVDSLFAGYRPGLSIVKGASLRVDTGEVVSVIGPNGAGKSTLLKAIAGAVAISAGKIVLNGDPVSGLSSHRLVQRGLGYVPQQANVFGSLTVDENLRVGGFTVGKAFAERCANVYELFSELIPARKKLAGMLSGGQRQMLAFARAMLTQPQVLLLDEPTAGLSPKMAGIVFEKVIELANAGVAILMVEQNAKSALRISHRAYVLADGTNRMTGTGESLMTDPEVVRIYLGASRKPVSAP